MPLTGKMRRRSGLLGATAALGVALLAAGCQGDALGSAKDEPARPKVTQSELRAFCPPVGLRQGTAFFTTYEKTRPVKARKQAQPDEAVPVEEEAPAQRVVYQTAITDVTRSCTREGGTLTLKVGITGRVVPGPAASPGSVEMPIRIAVVQGDEVLYSQLVKHEAQVSDLSTATQFLFTSDVSFTDTGTRGVRAFVGFDEGPPKED